MQEQYIQPNWPAPSHVHAASTTRLLGSSTGPYGQFNLGLGTGDDRELVLQNRQQLQSDLNLPSAPQWIYQTHGTDVALLPQNKIRIDADASTTQAANVVCVVMTADCLPVLLCDTDGTQIAAVHAGWRSLGHGILERTLEHFAMPRQQIMAWLGPAISVKAFEVGQDVFDTFCQAYPEDQQAFHPKSEQKYFADIYQLARLRLQRLGLDAIYGGDRCTYSEQDTFFSYRRDQVTGRMATLIWRS